MSWKACVATSAGPTGFGPMLYAGHVRECVAVSRELGFEGIEISMRSPDELDRDELEELLRAGGLELAALASGRLFLEDGLSLSDADETRRAGAVSRVTELIDYGAAFGAPVIVGLARGKRPPDGDLEGAVGRFVASMRECADHAATLGAGLVVEAINRYETALLNTAAQTVAAVEQIDRANVGVLLDSFHMNIEESCIGDAIRATGRTCGTSTWSTATAARPAWVTSTSTRSSRRLTASATTAGFRRRSCRCPTTGRRPSRRGATSRPSTSP